MIFPDREAVERVRKEFPVGCRIVPDSMDDVFAPPIGTQATVTGVDDVADVLAKWDNGSSLKAVYKEDHTHKIKTEEEARTTLNWYGRHQPEKDAKCPRCGAPMRGATARYALSRNAEIFICSWCGNMEGYEDAGIVDKISLMEWEAIKKPLRGEGAWTGK